MDPVSRQIRTIRQLVGKPIRAYHGSPNSFSRFDASKIGTGEGAQAYGHGLYFAGNEEVADGYRATLAGKYPPILIGDQPVEEAIAALPDIDDRLRSRYIARELPRVASRVYGMTDLDDALIRQATLFRMREAAEEGGMPFLGPEHLDALLLGRGMRLGKRPGHMYEVEIDYPEEALLDWDKPVGAELAGRLDSRMAGDLASEAQRMADMGQLPRHMQILDRIARGEVGLAPGEMVYRAAGRFDAPVPDLASVPGVPRGWGSVTNTINDSLTNQLKASERLMEAGIPGIRYLDQGSRSAGEGTRNYVLFPGTEDRIRILRKYGLLAPVAAGAAMEGQE